MMTRTQNNPPGKYRVRNVAWVALLLTSGLLNIKPVSAQEFSITSVELTTESLIVHYDLVDTTRNRTYTVSMYSSNNNFLAPLTKVTGDIGLQVKPGINRRIAWDAKGELGSLFDGEVELEIKGRVYVPFLRFEGFQAVEVKKRATPFLVKWSGGSRQNILDFQLWHGEKLAYTFPNIPNTGEYRLVIPSSVRPGSGYYLRIADTKNKDQVVVTSKFELKRKIPLTIKLLPILAAAYVAYAIINHDISPKPIEGAPGTP